MHYFKLTLLLFLICSCKKNADPATNTNGSNNQAAGNPTSGANATDVDGNIYHSVVIGSQVWMVENLKTTHYRDGTSIPNVTDDASWASLTTGSYCDYKNDANNSATYGRLYNWFATVDARNLAPQGWHVPTDADWTILMNYLGGEFGADVKLKEKGLAHWHYPNSGTTNETGFTALPAGYRGYGGTFYNLGNVETWWSTTDNNGVDAWDRYISYDVSAVSRLHENGSNGFSVRCVKN
jgi:uncharacterized protein (TIGR02145 family)